MTSDRFCACKAFELWYIDGNPPTRWCVCAHADDEHLDGQRLCVGDVVVLPAVTDEAEPTAETPSRR